MSSRLRSLGSTKISFFAFQDIITAVSGILILVTLILATGLDRTSEGATRDRDPGVEAERREMLSRLGKLEADNRKLGEWIAQAESLPDPEKLRADIAREQAELEEARRKDLGLEEQKTAKDREQAERYRALGLAELGEEVRRTWAEAEGFARSEAELQKATQALEEAVAEAEIKLLKLQERNRELWLIPDRSATTKEPILVTVSGQGAVAERFDRVEERGQWPPGVAAAEFGAFLGQFSPTDQYVVFLVKPSGIRLFQDLVQTARDRRFEVGFDAVEEGREVHFTTPPQA